MARRRTRHRRRLLVPASTSESGHALSRPAAAVLVHLGPCGPAGRCVDLVCTDSNANAVRHTVHGSDRGSRVDPPGSSSILSVRGLTFTRRKPAKWTSTITVRGGARGDAAVALRVLVDARGDPGHASWCSWRRCTRRRAPARRLDHAQWQLCADGLSHRELHSGFRTRMGRIGAVA